MTLSRAAAASGSWSFRILWTVVVVVPFLGMVLLAFRSLAALYNDPLGLSGAWMPGNFVEAWNGPPGGAGFAIYARNSVIVAIEAIVLSTILGALCAYFLTYLPARWRGRLLIPFLVAETVPMIALVIPFFQVFVGVGLLNNVFALGILYALLCLPTTVLVLYAFFLDFPIDIREAAALDGLGPVTSFVRIVAPLSAGSLGAVALLNMIWVWGETLIALALLQSSGSQTIPVGLLSFQDKWLANPGALFAGLAMATVPIAAVYLVFNRAIGRGVALGGFR